jgi:uncharacterized membrane protein (DUF373 family)
MQKKHEESLVKEIHDPLIDFLNKVVLLCVKLLAVLMVFVILWALADVVMHLYNQVVIASFLIFNVDSLIVTFGAFMAVLIAIEIFLNIVFYLKKDAIHVPLVLATALTAIARKVIILEFSAISPAYIYGIAAVIFSLGITYWLITAKTPVSSLHKIPEIK